MSENIFTGPIETRVYQFVANLTALRLEIRTGLRMSSKVSALTAGKRNGYIPASIRTKADAVTYMETVMEYLRDGNGSLARRYGEEIVCGWITPLRREECGHWSYKGTTASNILSPVESAIMHDCE